MYIYPQLETIQVKWGSLSAANSAKEIKRSKIAMENHLLKVYTTLVLVA